ncbi:helix-turn-helix protein [Pseudomonas sp. E141]|uniref:helix-turn-helix transcriptional regulator n=1 Tax=unclassified Pseudomonas TaxID=196821 RepID=UPI002934B734|nr:helix-turn-helix domain-containing protein [Pseudomonas sp. P105]WNZ78115.1 helix-turn-helix domain-containing protein [Pseudomonas sp. P105]
MDFKAKKSVIGDTVLILNPSVLGERMRALRRAKGYTQQLLAEKANCSRKTIIDLEAGENVAVYTLFRVVSALGMALEIVDKRIDLKSLADLVEHDE